MKMSFDLILGMNFLGPELIIILFGLSFLVAWILCLSDVIRSEFEGENEKLIYIVVLFIAPFIGMCVYYLYGKKRKKISHPIHNELV